MSPESIRALLENEALDPDAVADAVIAGLDAGRFRILPHPQVAQDLRRKVDDHDRWLRGMRRLQQKIESA